MDPGAVPAGTTDAALLARRRTRIALATSLVLIIILAAIALFATFRLYTTSHDRYVEEAIPLRVLSGDLILQMVNEETGVRGYLITGDPGSLQPYEAARPAVRADLAALRKLSARRTDIAPDVQEAERRVEALEGFFGSQIALVREGRAGQLRAQRNVLGGKARFDEFRAAAGALSDRSGQILRNAEHSQRVTFRRTFVLVLLVAGLAAAIAAASLIILPERMRVLYGRQQDARLAAERGASASRALTHVVDAVVLLDTEGAIRYWNPAAAAILGVPEPDAVNRPVAAVLPEIDTIDQALARGGDGAVVPVARGETERWLAVSETRFAEGRVLVLRDVTARQQLERAQAEFLATASHELRTPLAAIYGAVRTLRRPDLELAGDGLEEQLLEIVEQESERLTAIVEQILVSAQLDRHELRLDREAVDLRELGESVLASARLRASAAHTLALDAPEGIVVEADAARLRQVLANLIDNAVKYSPRGGKVELRVRARDGHAAIEVADEGIGIPADALPRVFEKFYRADPDMLGGVGGSGLGLYISRELVEQMEGAISVRSDSGGSTFTVELRRAPGSE